MPKYLYREANTFMFRRRVPKPFQERLHRKELYRSLKTSDVKVARQRAAELFLATERLFELANDASLCDEDIHAAVRLWLSTPHWRKTLSECVDQLTPGALRFTHEELPGRLLQRFVDPQWGITPVEAQRFEALGALREAEYTDRDVDDTALLDRVAEMMLSHLREYVDRRMDHVFNPERSAQVPVDAQWRNVEVRPHGQPSPKLLDHVDEWKQALVTGWRDVSAVDPHSAGQYAVAVRLFSEICGNLRMSDISYDDAEDFKEKLQRLPSSHGKSRPVLDALKAIKLADERDEPRRMTLKTAKRHNTALNRYWDWLIFVKRIPRTPSPFLGHKFPGTRSSSGDRDAWTAEDMERLFRSSDYRSYPHNSAYHWLPLISLHSGMRLEEICRLRPHEDIQVINGIPCFVIQKHPDGWDPKTEAGERKVPIHSWLINHGLMSLVELRRAQNAGRVFAELQLIGASAKLGAKFSRDFSRLKIAMGFGEKLVFHSFRHTFRTELESSDVDVRHIDAVMGHEGVARGQGRPYVKNVSVKKLLQVVGSFTNPLPLDFLETKSGLEGG